MKKFIVMSATLMVILCLVSCGNSATKEVEHEIDIDEMKTEVYRSAYKEGYMDAVEAMMYELPWYMVDADELENSLYMIFDDEAIAEEVRDLIFSYCELYERADFELAYSDSGMDFDY